LRHQDISALEIGRIQGPVAQWLEYLANIWGNGAGLGSNPAMVTFFFARLSHSDSSGRVNHGFPIARDA
jgi:hypothetical protein